MSYENKISPVPTQLKSYKMSNENEISPVPQEENIATDNGSKFISLSLDGLVKGKISVNENTTVADAVKQIYKSPQTLSYTDISTGSDVPGNTVITSDLNLTTTQKSSGG